MRQHHRVGPIISIQSAQYIGHVVLYGLIANVKASRHFLVCHAFSYHKQNFHLTITEAEARGMAQAFSAAVVPVRAQCL